MAISFHQHRILLAITAAAMLLEPLHDCSDYNVTEVLLSAWVSQISDIAKILGATL